MTLRGPVLVGTDLSRGADEALRQGARLAREIDSPLIVCHVLPEMLRVGMLFPQWRGAAPLAGEALNVTARDAIGRQLEAVLGDTARDVTIVIDSGTAHVGLLTQADAVGAGVVVTGPGRVAEQVVRHATVPVLIARPSPAGVVLGATDFSDPALPALQAAASEARRRGTSLHLVHSLDLGAYVMANATATADPYQERLSALALDGFDDLKSAAEARLQAVLTQLGIDGNTAVLTGHAADAIVGHAEAVATELVVVGTHGRSGLARLTLGSTAAGVVESAPCSVLVVRVGAIEGLAAKDNSE